MPDRHPHDELAAYALGDLEPLERDRVEVHVRGCSECQADLRELTEAARLLNYAPKAVEPPDDLRIRTLAAVQRAATEEQPAHAGPGRLSRSSWRGLALAAGAIAATAAVALFIGTRIGSDGPGGPVELRAELLTPEGAVAATARVVRLGIGREVAFSSDELPILPKDEFYELWFAGPGDAPSSPNRISAGTFHPDENGRSRVTLTAAVDPAKYPVLIVTAEPGDGNPAPSGTDVLRSAAAR